MENAARCSRWRHAGVDLVRKWHVSTVSAGSRNGHYWPIPSLGAAQRSGRSRRNSGHGAEIVVRSLLTHFDISPASIDALRRAYSPSMFGVEARGAGATTNLLLKFRYQGTPVPCGRYGSRIMCNCGRRPMARFDGFIPCCNIPGYRLMAASAMLCAAVAFAAPVAHAQASCTSLLSFKYPNATITGVSSSPGGAYCGTDAWHICFSNLPPPAK
jgi:hypothetical protein